jgi:hypothetical protein
VPDDVTGAVDAPLVVWEQFCAEARILHEGELQEPPPMQEEMPL